MTNVFLLPKREEREENTYPLASLRLRGEKKSGFRGRLNAIR